jgi:hypothetical protein
MTSRSSFSSLPAIIARAAAKATLQLPFRIPNKEWFTQREAGAVLGLSESMVEKLYDSGALTGHSHNAATGRRSAKRILRVALVAYAIRTSDYTDESLVDALLGCFPHLPSTSLLRISIEARKRAFEKGSS